MNRFIAYIWLTGWSHLSFGVSLCLSRPNLEVHLPFCFLRVGWEQWSGQLASNHDSVAWRGWGWTTNSLRCGRRVLMVRNPLDRRVAQQAWLGRLNS